MLNSALRKRNVSKLSKEETVKDKDKIKRDSKVKTNVLTLRSYCANKTVC